MVKIKDRKAGYAAYGRNANASIRRKIYGASVSGMITVVMKDRSVTKKDN